MATIDGIQNNDEEKKSLALQKIQEALVGFSSTAKKEILDELSTKTSGEIKTEKETQYAALQPTGFDDAPQSAQKKRKELVYEENTEKLQWIHDNISYNVDHTINIIKFNKTFCEDVSGTGQNYNWEEANVLAESKGYELPTDYNDCDSQEIRENSDWYKVINIFSDGKGDTVKGMEFFRDLAGCNYRYWTATPYKDKNQEVSGVACIRRLDEDGCYRHGYYTNDDIRVCGFKPAP